MSGVVYLKPKADRAARRRHPWVFSGAVQRVSEAPKAGDLVEVRDAAGAWLAWGHYNPDSRIAVRLLDWDPQAVVDEAWWADRLDRSAERRKKAGRLENKTGACRLVFAESDGLPGLTVDWYAGFAVLQSHTPGIDRIKAFLAERLLSVWGAAGVFERGDAEARRLEKLPPASGLLAGQPWPEPLTIEEGGLKFIVDPGRGQKTGFFIDQVDNRRLAATWAAERDVLDCFAHTFAFSAHAARAGAASVVRVESSKTAADLGEKNMGLNGLDQMPGETVVGDAFQVLRTFRDQGRTFGLIFLDPPKLAPTRAQVPKASRAYKDINLLAFKLLQPGGILATFSCSGGLDADMFQKIVFGASLDAGRQAQILSRLGQPPDHPILLTFPEASYLKGLLCQAW